MPIYRDTVIPLADVITPNQFEAEYVSSVLHCVCVCVSVCDKESRYCYVLIYIPVSV